MLQLQTYGWLFERMFGFPAARLEVHNGAGEIVEVAYTGPEPVMNALREIVRIKSLTEEPYAPVGFTRCGNCGYHDRCWDRAEANRSVSLVRGVNKDIALALHERKILTMDQLLSEFDEESLTKLERRRGEKSVRVGAAAASILRNAKSLASGEEILLSRPEIPESKNYVMFDLEGLPPQFDELQKVYLWGMQVFGETPSEYICSTAGFGVDGDRQGWEDFLTKASEIFDTYGDVPFVHWSSYEATVINLYLNRFDDVTGRATRVQKNLFDLLPIVEKSIVLPLPSYSLKVIEKYTGFERTQDEYGGNWSMAQYIEATETDDATRRDELMSPIRTYNREDLEATWAVLQWHLKRRT
jgi:predicted RecB family nuclease